MTQTWARFLSVLVLAVLVFNVTIASAAKPGITLIGRGEVPGDRLDKSGLSGNICSASDPGNCIPRAILGGFGSAISYTGHDGVFISAPDRGPFDGLTDVPYLNRFDFFKITTDVGAPLPNVRVQLLDTRFLKNEFGQTFVGGTGAFVAGNDRQTLRLDPEGIRVGVLGTFFISDEYGPYVFEFLPNGRLLRRLNVPDKFAIANPNPDGNTELLGNVSGRQANRGMEGLAITPDGRFLFGIMQNALIQDHGLGGTDGLTRIGFNNRILRIDLLTGRTKEYAYVTDATGSGQGVNELLAINDHEFLVLERDNKIGNAAVRKSIYKIDIDGATEISNVTNLPKDPLPASMPSITPVSKELFIDLTDAAFGIKSIIPEKIEGLAWGPDTTVPHLGKRHVLYVTTDNDLVPANPTQIYAFAIDPKIIDLRQQFLLLPIYPPWLVPKN